MERNPANVRYSDLCRVCDRYTYRVTWSDEDKEYIGLCAEFPSLS
jgi:hypothetical protein